MALIITDFPKRNCIITYRKWPSHMRFRNLYILKCNAHTLYNQIQDRQASGKFPQKCSEQAFCSIQSDPILETTVEVKIPSRQHRFPLNFVHTEHQLSVDVWCEWCNGNQCPSKYRDDRQR